MAPVPSLARNLHRRAASTTERAGSRPTGGVPFLRLVRGDHSGAGRGRGRLPGPFPREPQCVLPGEPFPGGQAGGNRARRRRGRDGARFVRGRGLIFAGARPALPPGDGGGIGRGGIFQNPKPKDAKCEFRTALLQPIDPATSFVVPWESIKDKFDKNIVFSKFSRSTQTLWLRVRH